MPECGVFASPEFSPRQPRHDLPRTGSYLNRLAGLIDDVMIWADFKTGDVFNPIFANDQNVVFTVCASTRKIIRDGEHGFHSDHHSWLQYGCDIFAELHGGFTTVVRAHHA